MHININIATRLFLPQLEMLSNFHYLQPQLYQPDNLFRKFWDVEVYGGMNHFLKRFNTTSNDKANRTLNLGKARLGRGEVIPLNYRQQCLQAHSAMLHILLTYSATLDCTSTLT